MKLTEVNKLKAYTQNEFSDDIVYLTIKANSKLTTLLKKACVESLSEVEESFYIGDFESESKNFSFKRFKAKSIFYRELNSDTAKNILYACDFLNNGLIKIPFYSVYKQSDFLSAFQSELKRLIELLIGENVEREISFNLTDTETA